GGEGGVATPPSPLTASGDLSDVGSGDIGSNSWAVAGRLTATGAALVASDMHLSLQVPPTWYRMRLRMMGTGGSEPDRSALDLNGLTLPGAPVLIAGSNGRVAWAFTNSDGDWLDSRPVTCFSIDHSVMQTPQGDVELSTVTEHIQVRGGPDFLLPVTSGPQGILLQVDPIEHRCWFASWIAESPAATNMNLLALERASSVQQVLALAPQIGIPEQNLIAGDSAGHIGWTIAGRIPLESGGTDDPRLYDPPIGRLWSANARATDDSAALQAIGGEDAAVGAQYTLGARARQIRDALLELGQPATPGDMLRIQLDDRAVFLARWRDLMLKLLDERALAGKPARTEMRGLLASWDAHADVDSVGYRLVRAYHDQTAAAVWQMILGSLGVQTDDPPPRQFERPLWTLVTTQPLNMLSADYPSWRAFLLFELDRTLAGLEARCGALDRCRWGAAHPVRIRHPLARAVPILSRLIDLPELELPGDHDMPRVQDGAFGASERFAVSPGHEAEGYLHIPGGESDHPLSPYYRAGFRAWAEGKPLPFLPGAAVHRLLLQPARGAVN
ncbi:MAG: penicillin acylase family protein, partial [Steroidobacteraceae bacterium]